jgi:CHASE3 domain sensor protein
MRTITKGLILTAIVTITGLLVVNFFLTSRNNRIIEENRHLQRQAEQVKVTVSQFAIIIIHNVDLGLRSFALFRDEKYLYPLWVASRDKDSIMQIVEHALINRDYPMDEFYRLRDSINSYVELNMKLLDLFRKDNLDEFFRLADQDKGYQLWLQYEALARKINKFEDDVVTNAQKKLENAKSINALIQLMLFFICTPTLLLTAFHAYKKITYEVKLRKSEAEKAEILRTQNVRLEELVTERTNEIQRQNRILQDQHEEISAKNQKITAQYDELHLKREELAAQNQALIESKKEQLDLYTRRLFEKSELIEQLSNEIEILKKKPAADHEQVQKFNEVLNSTILTDDDWEQFKKTFDGVYPNFFASLRYRFPDITAAELRLAALIKMNLTLKEAANALGISADSVKKSRYRLKKKIELGEEDSLEDFIRSL